ncbi:hypothetical protein HPP92_013996 [Vanilla planifolia]|uniref:Uncharacterized protein n=1 Tax=Vanilla planifolia TaxID=51239 RepID=A0A835UVT3_VANPL|nr:hypothetical protein HPP92_013996 [Vanilla planifolia]
MEESNESEHYSGFSSIADSVISRCCRNLLSSTDELLLSFETELSDNVRQPSKYARNFIEFCSYKTLHLITNQPDLLGDKEIRHLMFDMLLAWETPDTESERALKESSFCKHPIVEDEDDGSLFSVSATSMAVQVDYKNTVGQEAFAKITPACPIIADSITVNNLFDALTNSSGGQLHLLIYDKYLKCLNKLLNSARSLVGPTSTSTLQLAHGEIILDFEGTLPTKPIFQHIGIATLPGRLTLTNRALYFERFGVTSHDEAIRYDLATDLRQVVKRDLTGPWGARLFNNAVMYKTSSLVEPVLFEFPQFIGHSRRDYWLAIIREVLYAHKFIRKFNLKQYQQEEAISMSIFGIFRFRVIKDFFHNIPSQFRTTLLFNLAEKLPKGDKILVALYNQMELMLAQSHHRDSIGTSFSGRMQHGLFPINIYALSKTGFVILPNELWPQRIDILFGDVHVGETSQLQKAVKRTICYSSRAEAAQATLDQVKVEDIETNLTIMKELLFPLAELGKQLYSLTEWQDNFNSTVFLLLVLYILYRRWFWYMWPSIFLSLSALLLWNKYYRKGRQIEAFKIMTPPNRNTVELLLTLQETISQLEAYVQTGCIVLLKLRAIVFAAFPQTTNKVAYVLVAIAVIFTFVPLRHLVVVLLLEFYTREMPLRKASSEKLMRRLREWWVRIPAAPVQLIKPPESKKTSVDLHFQTNSTGKKACRWIRNNEELCGSGIDGCNEAGAGVTSTGINPNAKSYYLFDGYAHLSYGLGCGLAGLFLGMAIGIVGETGVRSLPHHNHGDSSCSYVWSFYVLYPWFIVKEHAKDCPSKHLKEQVPVPNSVKQALVV